MLHQTYKNYEVIVVDNSSTDETKHIIKKFRRKNIRYIFEGHRSRGAARNAGILVASGKIIAMTDADCIAPKTWLEGITHPIRYENEGAAIGGEEDLVGNYWTKNMQRMNEDFFRRNRHGKYINHIDTKNFAIKTSVIKGVMFDSELQNFEDLDLYLQLKHKVKIRFVSSVKVGHMYKTSFLKAVVVFFDRAFWTAKIYRKYKNTKLIKATFMFESISVKNFLSFPIWGISLFIKRPINEVLFLFISELSWRAGLLWALVLSANYCL